MQELNSEAAKDEISHYNPIGQTQEQISEDIVMLAQGFEIWVTVQGLNDQRVVGTIPMVFNSPRFPDKVKTLYINSELILKNQHNWLPRNRFELLLDFTKPQLFNLSLLPSEATPNQSNLFVSGQNEIWVNGLYRTVSEFLKSRKTRRKFFHRHSVYHWLLLCGGFPFAFLVVSKFSGLINSLFGQPSGILKSVVDVYIFYISLLLFRRLFEYVRWIFPIVEYKNSTDNAQKHKAILVTLIIAVLAKFVYDLIKFILP